MTEKPFYGKLALLTSVIAGIIVAIFYWTIPLPPLVLIVGIILFLVSIYFSVKSFNNSEKGFTKFTPLVVFIIYIVCLILYFISLMFIGEK